MNAALAFRLANTTALRPVFRTLSICQNNFKTHRGGGESSGHNPYEFGWDSPGPRRSGRPDFRGRGRGSVRRGGRQTHMYGDGDRGGRPRRGRGGHRGRQAHTHRGERPSRGRGSHPSGLSGREIGLWYAKRGQEKRTQMEKQNRKIIHMDDDQIGQVNRVLSGTEFKMNSHQVKEKALGSSNQGEDEILSDDDILAGFVEAEDRFPLSSGEDSWFEASSTQSEHHQFNKNLKEELENKVKNPKYSKMQEFRKKLPAFQKRIELIELINSQQVIVISGETGCGKTTQVPQFILDDAIQNGKGLTCKIVCTQPRRISAISVAERVAEERGEHCGEGLNSCGYQIRLDSKLPRPNASIVYCTTGILIQHLKSDPLLSTVSHIVLDEVHERDLVTDFLLTIMKGVVEKRKDLRIILMSATLNSELFSTYFGKCPCFHIPGFTYPVESIYLEEVLDFTNYTPPDKAYDLVADIENMYNGDLGRRQTTKLLSKNIKPQMLEDWEKYEKDELLKRFPKLHCNKVFAMHAHTQNNVDPQLIVSTIRYIVHQQPKGAILVFVPGWMDIKGVNDELLRDRDFATNKFLIIPLHSLMPTTNQRQVFDRPPPGVIKIVIATNIAETSITIDDVVHVIDSGKIKLTDFDHVTNMGSLQMQWISRSNAKQRRGRAGRVQDGFCYHLYTKLQEREFNDYLMPEMLRTPLDQLCLQILVLKLGKIEDFLSKVMEPPTIDSIRLSIQKLIGLSAMDADQNLTPLGYHLAKLPVEPQIGKMILMGAIFSCLDPVLTIAANLSFKDPFVVPLGKEKQADYRRKVLSDGSNSDHIMLLNAFQGWEEASGRGYREENEYCWTNFLARSTLNMLKKMKGQFAQQLRTIGFSPTSNPKDPAMNKLSNNKKVVIAIVCAGLYPNICKMLPGNPRKPVKLRTKTERKLDFHPKSVNCNVAGEKFTEQWLCYYLKMKTSGIYLFDTSEVTAYPLLFFGGKISAYYDKEMGYDVIAVDDWIVFRSKPNIAKLVKDLRHALDSILEQKIRDPNVTVLTMNDASSKVLSSIVNLITTE